MARTPMSYLHKAGDPRIEVIVNGVCGKAECESETRQAIQEEMIEAGAGGEAEVGGTCCARFVLSKKKATEKAAGADSEES
ncbi:hypothetical protein QQX98_001334 [Neonectria punicea]|uniref:BFD-like [2Fe-2S]-binding domain-containing protein n=1 Tax=Neonectria punicea TaxID=979145 RepID=A0ABR1HQ25_9HYPO